MMQAADLSAAGSAIPPYKAGPSCPGEDIGCTNYDIKSGRIVAFGTPGSVYVCYGCSASSVAAIKALQSQTAVLARKLGAGSKYQISSDGHFGAKSVAAVGVIAWLLMTRGIKPVPELGPVIIAARSVPNAQFAIKYVARYAQALLDYFQAATGALDMRPPVVTEVPPTTVPIAPTMRKPRIAGFFAAGAFLVAATLISIVSQAR